jgi:hypothetical protein
MSLVDVALFRVASSWAADDEDDDDAMANAKVCDGFSER